MTRNARRYGSSSAGLVGAGVGQLGHLGGDGDQPRRHRQLLLEIGEFGQVVRQRGERGAAGGQPDDVGGHVRVPVAVAADPRAGPQDGLEQQLGIGPTRLQRFPNVGVDLRNHLEQRGRVIAQPDGDLVGDLQPGQPDQRGLPQRQDLAAQLQFDVAAVVGFRCALGVQAHQLGDPVLGDEDGAPPGLGGMCGDDRRNQGALQRVGHGGRLQFCQIEFGVSRGQAAVLRWLAGLDVNTAATLAVDVFGDIGQQREMAERPDDRDRQVDVDPVEHGRHLGPVDLGVSHPERLHPGALDEVEHLVAVLLAHGVAEDGAQQPDVRAHRLGRLTTDLGALNGADRFERGVGYLNHGFQYRCGSRGPPAETSRGQRYVMNVSGI